MSAKFEEMTVEQVYVRTGCEGAVQRGKPRYADRAWTQLHDEMIDGEARTVGDLPRARSRGATRRDRSAGNQLGSPQASSVTGSGQPGETDLERTPSDDVWLKRRKDTQVKLAGGEPLGLAEVVRDGALRERRLIAKHNGSQLLAGERDL